jgi:hypothetical protein
MLEKIESLPGNVVGVKAVGTVSKEDYVKVLEPMLDEARREGRRIRLLYQLGPEFEQYSGGAAWEDARLGLSTMRLFEAIAVVTDLPWLRKSVGFAGLLTPYPMRVFANDAFDEALAWLESIPEGSGLSYRMLSDVGVMVVEPKGPLRAADFDALALVADPWIASHGDIHGIVIHAVDFPGWEDLGSFVRHVKFVRDHHRKIGKVALAADTKLADLAPRIADHFVAAEVRHFDYDDVDAAIAWAGADSSAGGSGGQ